LPINLRQVFFDRIYKSTQLGYQTHKSYFLFLTFAGIYLELEGLIHGVNKTEFMETVRPESGPINRRAFLKLSAISGTGLLLGISLINSKNSIAAAKIELTSFEPSAFLKIGSDNRITIMAKNPEIGQGVKTSLPQIIAEELEVEWDKIEVLQADFDSRLGDQFAGGSTAIKENFQILRQVGASAREMLVEAAAKRWQIATDQCYALNGCVYRRNSELKFTYGEVAEDASKINMVENPRLKDPKDFKILGKPIGGVDNKRIVNGSVRFGIDSRPDGALVAVVLRCPVKGGKLKRFDDTEAIKVNGVRQVFDFEYVSADPRDSVNGVAVLADHTWAAMKGRKALKVEWDYQGGENESTENITKMFVKNVSGKGELMLRDDGNVDAALSASSRKIEATYEVPFLSHATMEPMNFFADVQADKCLLIGPTQVPGSVFGRAKEMTGVSDEKISVKMTRVGGGFGRRLTVDYACEAIAISKKAGKPVQVVWTREDDMENDLYRPAGMYHLKGALDEQGNLAAWHINASTTSRYLFANSQRSPHTTEIFPDSFPAGFVGNFRMEYTGVRTKIPTGAWRAPGHNATCLVEQSFVDELAHLAGKDPVDFRLGILGETDKVMPYRDHGGPEYSTKRLKNVIRTAAAKGGWYSPAPTGLYRGFACHFMFGAYVAEIVTISLQGSQNVKVENVFCVVDCGIVVNKSGAANQIEGGIIDGLNAAMNGVIHIEKGSAKQNNFDSYKMMRIREAPKIDVVFIESSDSPEGLGEMALPPVSAALCNAIFSATGKRIRRLPLRLNGMGNVATS
jgi:isoquinoline 1-oxidoreductase subunit beta